MIGTFVRALIWNFAKWLVFHHDTGKTNATFFRTATAQRNDKDQRPSAWHWLPGWKRLAIKLAVAAFLVLTVIWWFTHDAAQRLDGAIGIACLLVAGAWMLTLHRVAEREHARQVVAPLQAAVNHIIGEAA